MSEQPNCFTLPDGDCVGGPCMHNPGIKPEDTPIQRASKAIDGDLSRAYIALAVVYRDLDEYEALSDLQRKRELPWITRWRLEQDKPDSLPDYGAMLGWILDKADKAEAERARLEQLVLDQQREMRKMALKLEKQGKTNIELNKRLGQLESVRRHT